MLDQHHWQRLRFLCGTRRRRWCGGDEIGKIELAISAADEVGRRMREPDFAECPGPAEERRELEIDVEFIESGEGFAVSLHERQSANREGKRIRVQLDLSHRGLPVSQARQAFDQL